VGGTTRLTPHRSSVSRGGRALTVPATVDEARRPFAGRRRLLLALEVFGVYLRARWLLASKDLPQAVTALRADHDPEHDWSGDRYLALVIGARLGSAVRSALSVLPTDNRCLVRSLVLTNLLARRGIGSSLVIGVRSGSRFAAHAWVERDGAPLLPTEGYTHNRLVKL
jgi:hypothetical protein